MTEEEMLVKWIAPATGPQRMREEEIFFRVRPAKEREERLITEREMLVIVPEVEVDFGFEGRVMCSRDLLEIVIEGFCEEEGWLIWRGSEFEVPPPPFWSGATRGGCSSAGVIASSGVVAKLDALDASDAFI
jgi:hypothetical protein